MLEVRPVPAFRDNYIWLIVNSVNRRAAIVDPGDAAPVLETLQVEGLSPAAILVTHHHWDHAGGVPELIERHPVPVFGPAGESIPGRTRGLREGDHVDLEDLEIRFSVLDIPGHTAGHIAYVGSGMAFVGDTLFLSGCGRLFEGTARQMYGSLGKLAALPDDTAVYCGHEYTLANLRFAHAVEPGNLDVARRIEVSTGMRRRGVPTVPGSLSLERLTNPFLRVNEPAVREAAEHRAGTPLHDPVEVYATLRAWKDSF